MAMLCSGEVQILEKVILEKDVLEKYVEPLPEGMPIKWQICGFELKMCPYIQNVSLSEIKFLEFAYGQTFIKKTV